VSVTFTHQVADGLHAAIVKATKPATATTAGTAKEARAPAPARTTLPLASPPGCC
jgi:hypothetical protein